MKPSDEIEACVHSAIVDAYSRRVAEQNFDHLLQDGVLRSRFLSETLVELFGAYGTEWTGGNAAYKDSSSTTGLTAQLRDRLKSLSHRSQFLSFHLFDPLDNKRRSIASVLSSDFLATDSRSAPALKLRYETIERLYIRLSTDSKYPVPTLVNSLQQSVSRGPAKYFAFHINDSPLHSDWPFIKFPLKQCEELFESDALLTRWRGTNEIHTLEPTSVIHSLLSSAAHSRFPVFQQT